MGLLQLLFLLVVLLAGYERSPAAPPAWPTPLAAGLVLLGVLLVGLLAEGIAAWFTRSLWYDRKNRFLHLRRYHRLKLLHLLVALGIFLASVFYVGWDQVVRDAWGLRSAGLVSFLLILLPFVLGMLLAWAAFYRVELVLHQTASTAQFSPPFWSRGEFVLFQARQQFGVVLAAAFIFVACQDMVARLLPNLQPDSWQAFAVQGGVAAAVMVALPWLLTVIWPTRSLVGPLRRQLDAAARRLRFRCTDIRVWDTGGGVANAMVSGLLPVPRFVLFSDVLIDALPPEEIEAVFGHEMGHIRHRHIPLFLVFLILSTLLFTLLSEPLLAWLTTRWNWMPSLPLTGPLAVGFWAAHALVLAAAALYLFLVFGLLSRTCEREADLFGCRSLPGHPSSSHLVLQFGVNGVSQPSQQSEAGDLPDQAQPHGIRVFISALKRVASLNGIDPERPSWRHGSIASRVRFLESLLLDSTAEARFQRQALFLKLGVLFTLAGLVGLCWWWTGGLRIEG